MSGSARGAVRADLDEVFRRDYQRVVGVAARVLGSRDQAEDVAQEVFLSFGRSSVPAGEARGWLCVAAAHTALNLLRSGRRRASREETAAAADDAVVSDVAEAVVTLEERSRVRAALARLPRKQADGPRAAAQRPELRRGRRGARLVPRQRRHHRAARRIRPAQGAEPSCVIRLKACCAGCSTSRPGWPTPTASTSPAARSASTGWPPSARTPPSSTRRWRPRAARTSTSPPRGGACRRPMRPRTGPASRRHAPRAGRSRAVLRRPVVAALAVAVVLAGAGTAAANDWLQIFRTEQIAPVSISTADLVALPDLSAYGELAVTGDPDVHEVADAAAAAAETGLDVPEVTDPAARGQRRAGLPGGRQGERHLHLLGGARRPGRRRGRETLPPPPPGLDGSSGAAGRRPGRGPDLVVLRRGARPRRRSRRRADGVLLRRPVRDGARLPAVAARPARRRRRAAAHVHRGRLHPAAARARRPGHHVVGARWTARPPRCWRPATGRWRPSCGWTTAW